MTLTAVSKAIAQDEVIQESISDLAAKVRLRLALPKSAISYVAAAVAQNYPVVLIAATERAAQDYANV